MASVSTRPAPGAPGPARLSARLQQIWSVLVDGLAALGTVLIGVLMLIICADVVARNIVGASLPLVSELGALTVVMIVYLQLATTIRHDRLSRTEFQRIALARWPRVAALVEALFALVGGIALAYVAWATLGILQRDVGAGQFIGVTGVATLPTWPFRLLILVGMVVAALQFAIQVLAALAIAARGESDATMRDENRGDAA